MQIKILKDLPESDFKSKGKLCLVVQGVKNFKINNQTDSYSQLTRMFVGGSLF